MKKEKYPNIGGFTSYDIQTLRLIDKLQNDEMITPTQFDRIWELVTRRDRNIVTATETWYVCGSSEVVEKKIKGWHRFGVFCHVHDYNGKFIQYWSLRKNKTVRVNLGQSRNIRVS